MPLKHDAVHLIRTNLNQIRQGKRAQAVIIGHLTEAQLNAINEDRSRRNFQPLIAEVIFIGSHIYNSRCVRDGYTIEDVIQQITSAMHENSVVQVTTKMTALQNPVARTDALGNQIRDKAIFECSSKYPRPELYSVIPAGDKIRPK